MATALPGPARPVRLLVVLTVVASALSLAVTGASQAEPRPSLAAVAARVDALNAQADAANERYLAAKIALGDARRKTAEAQHRVQAAQAAYAAMRRSMAAVADAAYRSGGNDPFVMLVVTSGPQAFLDRASTLDRIAAQQAEQLSRVATARHRLATAQATVTAQLHAQQAVAAAMASNQATILRVLEQQRQLLGSLKAAERARLAQLAEARASRSRAMATPHYTGSARGMAAIALREAYRQLGKPYRWGAAGPDEFDCSGLTMWAWGKAGVSLPHYTGAQWNVGRHVAESELQPGDLVFFGSDLGHMGMYVGGGSFIHAPHTGDVVKISSLSGYYQQNYAGAVRVTG